MAQIHHYVHLRLEDRNDTPTNVWMITLLIPKGGEY